MITQVYASLVSGFFLLLTIRIFALREKLLFSFTSFGKDNIEIVHRAVIGHGNFIEYALLFFMLLNLAEKARTHDHKLHCPAFSFAIARLLHGILVSFLLRKSIIL